MTTCFSTRRTMALLLGATIAIGGVAHGQEPLKAAKAHYASAAYEDALRALEAVPAAVPPNEAAEVAAYRAFCLLALGRTDEARVAVESLVLIDPLYRPSEAQASPRVRAFFDETRAPLLPVVARLSYANARDAFERGDLTEAAAGFTLVVKVIDDLGEIEDGGLLELRVLARGFQDLVDRKISEAEAAERAAAEAAAAEAARKVADPVPTETPESKPAVPVPAEPDPDRVYTDEDPGVVRPEVRSRQIPDWTPPLAARTGQPFSGVLELIVGRDGKVETALMRESVHPLYDPVLLRAARGWRFTPATSDGEPVRYRYRLGVRVGGMPD